MELKLGFQACQGICGQLPAMADHVENVPGDSPQQQRQTASAAQDRVVASVPDTRRTSMSSAGNMADQPIDPKDQPAQGSESAKKPRPRPMDYGELS